MNSRDIKVHIPEASKQFTRVLECYGIERTETKRGTLVWAVGDGSAAGATPYRDYDWPEVFTLCFDIDTVTARVDDGADRITIPLPKSLHVDQALAILLEHLVGTDS